MKKRALFFIENYLLTVLIFIIAKLVFMLCNQDGHAFTVGDVLDVVIHGLSLDFSTALYFVILPFLVIFVSIYWYKKNIFIKILSVYNLIVALAFALAFVADTSLYKFWQFKLDASCLQYLETPTEAMASVSWWYITIRVVIFLFVAFLIYKAFQATVRRLRTVSPRPSDWKSVAFGLLAFLVSIPLFVIGIRGGLGESTTNIGQVYYSSRQFLNHSAVNPVFSFLASLEKDSSSVPEYKFMEEDERARLMANIYPTKSVDPDTLLRTKTPNVVIILLESCGGIFTEDIGGRKDIMPNLNRYVHEGIYFSQFYANSYRTDRGTLCTLSGYPSFPKSSVMKMPAKTRFLPGIAKSLRDAGYQTSYIYGGDINFTNMRSYLMTTGFDQLHWQKDYTLEEQRSANWGVRDDITFATLSEQIAQFKPNEHYLIGYSTLSSHEPWDVPTHELKEEIPNAFNYLDQCLGNFIEKVRKTTQWDNLLVVLLPDHGFTYFGVGEEHEMHDHVPMLWLGGAVKEPRRIDVLCNQTDLPATLLGQFGLPHDDFLFSRDILSRNYTYPFAVHTYNNGITMKDSTGFAVYDLNANRIIVDKSTDSQALIRKGMAILQTASEHINTLGTNNQHDKIQ